MPGNYFRQTSSSDVYFIASNSLLCNACYDGLEPSCPQEQSAYDMPQQMLMHTDLTASVPWMSHVASNTVMQGESAFSILNPYFFAGDTASMPLPLSPQALENNYTFQTGSTNLPEEPTTNHTPRAIRRTPGMQRAIESKRKREARFECSICQQLFTSKHSKERHIKSHRGIRYKCHYCNKTYSTQSDCRRHEKKKQEH